MVTVVMPCYNEAGIIEGCVREWHAEVIAKIPGADLIVVDDCSTDGSPPILERLAAELPRLRCLRTENNGGHGRALRFGFRHCGQDYIFQTDGDRQHLASDFWKLWQDRDAYDFVFGFRARRADGAARSLIAWVLRGANWLLWGVWIADANCPFKLMKSAPLRRLLERIPPDCFIPMVMVSVFSRKMGFRVREVPVTHLPRRGGTQSVQGLTRWMRVGALCLRQLLALRLRRE